MPKKIKRFFSTYREAKKYLNTLIKSNSNFKHTHMIYDLKKTHPRRIKTHYLVGTYYDWLEL